MASTANRGDSGGLDPDAAFSALGNDTRVAILRALGEADDPLSFSALRNHIGLDQGEHFNYHLDQLVGHYVRKTDEGYELRPAGKRVVKAVLSGAVTKNPSMERTRIEAMCQLCGSAIDVRYSGERVETFCTECDGVWGAYKQGDEGYLGGRLLPPAGLDQRSAEEIYRVAWVWTQLKIFAIGDGICPDCSSPIRQEPIVCEEHDDAGEFCEGCQRRYAATLHSECTNCIFEIEGTLPMVLASHTRLLDLMTAHGLNPISPTSISEIQTIYSDYDEEILSSDPFEARLTFTVREDQLSFTIDDSLSVTAVSLHD